MVLSKDDLQDGFSLGDWAVSPARRSLTRGDEKVVPEPKVFNALIALARRNGDVVSRDQLVEEVWAGRMTGDDAINRVISQLRRVLGDIRPYQYIELIAREGYRLKMPVVIHEEATAEAAVLPSIGRKPNGASLARILTIGTITLIAVASIAYWWLAQRQPQSVAILPVANASGDPANEYLGAGLKAELLQTLYRMPDVRVTNSHLLFADQPREDIRKRLRVDFLLNTELYRDGDQLTIYYTLTGRRGVVEKTDKVIGRIEDLFGLQKQLATLVEAQLFDDDPQPNQVRTRPPSRSTAAYDRFIRGLYIFERRADFRNLQEAIDLFKETITLDPSYGPAHLALAEAYALAPVYIDGASPAVMHQLAIETVENGIQQDDSIRAAAATVYGYVYHKQKRWGDAERSFRRAIGGDVVDSNAFNLYSQMLAAVGRLDDSLDYAMRAYELDPTSTVMNSRVALAATWVGDNDLARTYFERTAALGEAGPTHNLGHALFYFRNQDLQAAYQKATESAQLAGTSDAWIEPVFAALADNQYREVALAALDKAAEHRDISYQAEFFVRTYLRDIEGAYTIAQQLRNEGEVFEMDILWIPEIRPFREHADFHGLIESLNITDYWQENACQFVDDRVSCAE